VSLRRLQISPLGVARRATRPRPTVKRLLPLVLGTVGFVVSVATATQRTGIELLIPVMATFALMIYGIVAAGPWITVLTARAISRSGRRASALLAGRRLEDDPIGGFRTVSGLVVAVFVASVFSGLTPAVLAEGRTGADSLVDDTTLVANLPVGTPATTGTAALAAADEVGGHNGIVLHADPDPDRPLTDPARGRSHTLLVACVDVAVLDITEPCPADGTAWVDTGLDDPLHLEASPYTAAEAATMPAELLVVETDGSAVTTDRVRTAIGAAVPGARPSLGAEHQAEAIRQLIQLNRIVNLALAITLAIAGCSLAVAVAAGIIERKRPFTLLRLAGMRLSELRRTALLEAAAPLLLIATASAALGLATAAVMVGIAGGLPWKPPSVGYWTCLLAGLMVALGLTAATLPLLGRVTAPSAVRFE
jgi:hypothetical protein